MGVDNNNEIEIIIKGPRGSGKTTIAAAIVQFLRTHGQAVSYVGDSCAQEKSIEELIDHVDVQKTLTLRKQIMVRDKTPICPRIGSGGERALEGRR